SPVLANIYLHYVLDLWFQKIWRSRVARGDTIIVRYADDFVVGFKYRQDAEQFLSDLKDRLAKFSLELHPDKTRLIEFGKFATVNRRARGERRPETFDFLGFTHYCRTTRKGGFGLGRKPMRKRVNRTLKRIKIELRRRMHHNRYEVAKWLARIMNGWLGYYAVPTSFRSLKRFMRRLLKMWCRMLRRRSQKDRTTLASVGALAHAFWPPLRIRHPWPTRRFAVTHSR
ncbi:MAG: reverse transcriptase domain-containing protein, partial [Rhodospirillaceae bacterium]|nr:reverse transcriptase domain-containing protein [Rhodospirillaceae bacterium]